MQMRPEIQIQSILKAMTDVVLPALDPANRLAQEQARLCMGLLALMGQQLPQQYRFDCDELARLVALSRQLATQAAGGAQTREALAALDGVTSHAAAVLERAKAEPTEVYEAVRALRTATGAVATAAYDDPECGSVDAVQRSVLKAGHEQMLRDRSMMLMQNWEMDPASIPPLSQLLAPVGGTRVAAA